MLPSTWEKQAIGRLLAMTLPIRTFGDPGLKINCAEVTDIDGSTVTLCEDMIEAMYAAPGIGLAAPQVGVLRRFFVFDLDDGDGPDALFNPEIVESDGVWAYDEGCLSIPELYFPIERPKTILVKGINLDGDEVSFEADELFARLVQHELDHLNGVLLLDHLDKDQRKDAMRILRRRAEGLPTEDDPLGTTGRRGKL